MYPSTNLWTVHYSIREQNFCVCISTLQDFIPQVRKLYLHVSAETASVRHWQRMGRKSKKGRQDRCHRSSPCCLFPHTDNQCLTLNTSWVHSSVTCSALFPVPHPCLSHTLIEVNRYSYISLNNVGNYCDHKNLSFRWTACHALGLVNDPFKHNSYFFFPGPWGISLPWEF